MKLKTWISIPEGCFKRQWRTDALWMATFLISETRSQNMNQVNLTFSYCYWDKHNQSQRFGGWIHIQTRLAIILFSLPSISPQCIMVIAPLFRGDLLSVFLGTAVLDHTWSCMIQQSPGELKEETPEDITLTLNMCRSTQFLNHCCKGLKQIWVLGKAVYKSFK